MFRTLFIAGVLFLFFFGCAVKAPQQEKTASGTVSEIVKVEKEEIEKEEVEKEEKDPCEVLIDEVVLKSRKTMKTVKESCQDLRIEVNPMWNINYDGTVHIRVYDAEGKKIRDELQKPSGPQEGTN
ncbi:MAG: hypothetical protein AMK70_00295 [Nitrospira bacterium SG8_35_1]|nr:MAG: hypothetical protein AMK70_00295 [Nitrospira bacterium SG8_35_1]